MAEFHDTFRVAPGSFAKAMATYDALAELQRKDPRLRIHSISTATDVNVDEIRQLTTYLYERCPQMDHHNLAIIRGDRKNPALKTPDLDGVLGALRLHPPAVGTRARRAATAASSSRCCSGPRSRRSSVRRRWPAAAPAC